MQTIKTSGWGLLFAFACASAACAGDFGDASRGAAPVDWSIPSPSYLGASPESEAVGRL